MENIKNLPEYSECCKYGAVLKNFVNIVSGIFYNWMMYNNDKSTLRNIANFDVKFQTKFLCNGFIKKNIFPEKSFFLTSHQKWHFDVHFDVFSAEVWPRRHPADLPFRSVYCYYRPLEDGRNPARLWSSTAPVWIPNSFCSRDMQSARDGGFSVRTTLSLFLSGQLAPHYSGQFEKL
jgi:hypothetical protein